jgi:hypothetical protein
MAVIECGSPVTITGSGRASYSTSSSAAGAMASALAMLQTEADNLAGLEALSYRCRKSCPHMGISRPAAVLPGAPYSTSWRLIEIFASLFHLERRFSGHVDFTWSAKLTCNETASQDTVFRPET